MVGEERRRNSRVSVDFPGAISGADGREIACRVSDVSVSGMKVHLPSELQESASVVVRVHVDCEFIIHTEGLVAWHKAIYGENIYGITIPGVENTEKEGLLRMVRQCLYAQGGDDGT